MVLPVGRRNPLSTENKEQLVWYRPKKKGSNGCCRTVAMICSLKKLHVQLEFISRNIASNSY